MNPREPRPSVETRRRRWLPWVISAGVHALVFAWWASLPDYEPSSDETALTYTPIEWIELPPASAPIEPEPVVAPSAPAEPESAPRDSEPSSSTPPEPTSAPPSRPSRPRVNVEPSGSSSQPPAVAVDPEPAKPSGGVALLGLRAESQDAAPRTTLRPSLAPPEVGTGQVVRQVGAAAIEMPGPSDAKPRSLAEAGFKAQRNGKMTYTDRASGFKATLLPDGRVKFRITVTPSSMPGLSEMIRAGQGQELYQQQKKRLLEATFDLRLAMAVEFARDKLDRRLKSLYRELLDDWSRSGSTDEQRRKRLFDRWDECEEGLPVRLPGFEGAQSSELDDMRRDGGEQARATIMRFIRRQLPKGSPQAYGAEELRQLNASRRSRSKFAPY